jgi:hypothetical protein
MLRYLIAPDLFPYLISARQIFSGYVTYLNIEPKKVTLLHIQTRPAFYTIEYIRIESVCHYAIESRLTFYI